MASETEIRELCNFYLVERVPFRLYLFLVPLAFFFITFFTFFFFLCFTFTTFFFLHILPLLFLLLSSSSSSFGTTTLCEFSPSQPGLSKFFRP
jgi:hypothetical protein